MGVGPSRWLDAAKLLGGLAAASASWHFIEQPILKLKDRFPYSRELVPQQLPVPEAPGERFRRAVAGH
jgi:peptidoglycan/LPS O-acetylase OafA/YrhL